MWWPTWEPLAYEAVCPPKPDPRWPKIRERYHDLRVDQRRGWSHAEVINEGSATHLNSSSCWRLARSHLSPCKPVAVPGLGIYPRHLLANTHSVQRVLPLAVRHARTPRPVAVHGARTDR